MDNNEQPPAVELAPLSREQAGPFLLLGVDKDAVPESIEAHWAQRVIWARKNQLNVPLQDVNWAREILNDFQGRVRADVSSLNTDTIRRTLRQLAERYGIAEPGGPTWEPLDIEQPLAEFLPQTEIPDPEEIRRSIVVPELPWEVPAVGALLDRLAQEPLDPWKLPLEDEVKSDE